MNILYPHSTEKLPIFKKRFINEMPQLIKYSISVNITEDIISIMYYYKKINITIQITTNYPWKAPLILLNNVVYSDYIKSSLLIKNLECMDNNILYSNYIKSNIHNIANVYSRYDGKTSCTGNNVLNIPNKYNILNKYKEEPVCLFCKSITNRVNWCPTRRLGEVIDETKKFIDYKQHSIIMLILRVIKRKYLVNDIPLEDFMNYKLVL